MRRTWVSKPALIRRPSHRRRGWWPIVVALATVILTILTGQLAVLALGLIATVVAFLLVRQSFAELVSMPVLRRFFRMETVGPGIDQFPMTGSVLVIANHASHFDPPILAHELPRPVTGVMTSTFYDRWYFYPLAKWIWSCIRVPDDARKTDAPEVDAIIASLDRGRSVLLFPEGWLRRKEEVTLRRFGQGIWRILKERPQTVIVPCWIDGTWGSRFSYKDGPPGGSKPPDRGRLIRVGVGAPFVIDPSLLADHWATRFHLMTRVADCRALVNLEPLENVGMQPTQDND